METISGLTNWRLSVRREGDGITILRAVSCDRRAVLPDALFGLPVTALHDRALAHGATPLEGEEVRILGGAESEDWDNRNIKELTLPHSLREIGDYAFMNLRSMETLRFHDGLRATGSASFMNCRSFSRVELTRSGTEQGPALASIVRSLQRYSARTGARCASSSLSTWRTSRKTAPPTTSRCALSAGATATTTSSATRR